VAEKEFHRSRWWAYKWLKRFDNAGLRGLENKHRSSGGKITFYGKDPIVPSPIRFGTMAAISLTAKTVGAAAVWRLRSGEGQDIHVDVRKALRRFAPFFEREWER